MSIESLITTCFPEHYAFIVPVDGTNTIPPYNDEGLQRIRDIWNHNNIQLSTYLSNTHISPPKMTPLKSKDEAVKSLSRKILDSVRANHTGLKQLYDITNQVN